MNSYRTVCAKLPPEDEATMVALEEAERLTRADIVRRALRHYAEHLGVKPEPKRKRQPKPSNP